MDMTFLSSIARGGLVAAFLAAVAAPAFAADPYASDWAVSAKSRARLIADGAGGAGLQIELAPGAITYWRDPGDAGLPPTFDFAASRNVSEAEAEFPAPQRIPEPDGSVAIGYRDAVIFPIRVAPKAVGQPSTLNLTINYAVCEKICLPAHAALSLDLSSGASSPHAPALAAAKADLPAPATPSELASQITTSDGRAWRLCLAADPQGARQAFVEGPSGYWFTEKADGIADARECFALTLTDAPEGAAGPIPARLTLVGPQRAIETRLTLPAKS